MGPHGRGGIGKAAVGEGIGGKQVAEIVWRKRQRNREQRKNGEAEQNGGHPNGSYGQTLSLRQLPE